MQSAYFSDIDLILPVPLHPKRKAIRGYNQSEMIAQGLSQTLSIPMDTSSFVRKNETQTQTKKDRFERWNNVKEVFAVENADALRFKHLLLVDDVITTGSTLEGCIRKLSGIKGVRVSVACLAIPNH